jgi:predicted RNase H-like nuclease (RuvC/YqgF family)
MENLLDDLSGNLDQAVKRGDVELVAQLLTMRDRADLEATVREIADLQNAIFEKESEREALARELEHLSEPVKVALQGVASALETLEQRRLELGQLQLRQGCIDQGLESHRQEINELRKRLSEMMEVISK